VTLVEAGDAASEARVAARAVLDALAAGVALERIAIVPVDLAEAFLEPLRFELSRARIPFVEPRGRPVIAAPRAHAALELVRLARGPIVRDGLIDVLRVPGLAVERWFSEEQIGELCHELAALPLRVERTPGELLTELDTRFAAAPDATNEASFAKLRGGLARFLAELAELGASASREQHPARLSALFDGLALLEASPRTLSRALERAERGAFDLLQGLGHDAVAAASVRTALERSLAAARALGLHAETIPLHTWLQELELSLEGVAPARGAARAAAVRIARPDDVAALEMDLVVLCRASDASLDRGASLDATLGSEIEARLPAGERPPSALTEQHFTALSIACALSRAARVVITWSAREETATLAPSRLARALLAGRDPRREPASSLSPAAKRCVKLAAADDNATRRSQIELGRVDFYADPEHPLDAWNGAAGSLERFFGRDAARPIAVTTLERGLRCSFLAFANHVLRAARVDPMGDAIGVRERGSLLHEALAAALDATRADAANLTPEECVEHGIEAARAVLNRRGRSPLRRLGLRNTLSDVRAVLNFVFRTNDGLAFRRAEQGFGENLEWRPLAVGPWQLSGRIDRIDATSDGRRARVIDYKTRTPGKSDDALALQPWLYAQKAALEMGATNVEFCFLGVDRREPRLRVVYDGPADGEAIQNAQQRASEMLLSLEAGRVAARPASSAFCVRCDARDICRRPLSAPSPESADE
jgi:RecB family exonuclease